MKRFNSLFVGTDTATKEAQGTASNALVRFNSLFVGTDTATPATIVE